MSDWASLRSLPKGFERSKWGEAIVAAVRRGLARDPKSLPGLDRPRPPVNGQATIELLKVLLRMTAERHGVAARVIATADDLDRIAADDNAEVPALHGWRRELFGENALALKHGRLSLAIENGRVVAVERGVLPPRRRDESGGAEMARIPSQSVVHRRCLSRARRDGRWRARSATSR